MGMIREVLDSCEYSMKKNMENFLIGQLWVFEKSTNFLVRSTNDKHPMVEEHSREKNRVLNVNGGARQQKDKNDIQKEVLAALFNGHGINFNATMTLEKMRIWRIAIIGDSIGRNQWETMLCMLATARPSKNSIYEVNESPITKHKGSLV